MSSQIVTAEKRFRISLLLDTYGDLLTGKQRTFLQRYYEEDLSFGEIAREFNVSRQAIFDSVKHGTASLEHYEKVLGLVEAGYRKNAEANGTHNGAASTDAEEDFDTSSRSDNSGAQIRRIIEAIDDVAGDGVSNSVRDELLEVSARLESIMQKIGAGDHVARHPVESSAPVARPAPSQSAIPVLLRGGGPEVD